MQFLSFGPEKGVRHLFAIVFSRLCALRCNTSPADLVCGAILFLRVDSFRTPRHGFTSGGSDPAAALSFEKDARPIFKAFCFDCHGAEAEHKGGLDLRLRRLIAKGGETGPAIVPGDAAKSLLIEKLRAGEMPPSEKKVPPEQIAKIEAWIAAGAATLHDEPAEIGPEIDITPEERSYWAFQPPALPPIPQFASTDRVRTSIDAVLAGHLREKGLSFSPDADRPTLIRRASFDLLGLPPTPDEIARFVADPAPDAYEQLIDRLLASPHYGERWGRHWLDVAGYADSRGSTADGPAAVRLQISRLRYPGAQCRQAVGMSFSSSNWPATNWFRRPTRISRPTRSTSWWRPVFCGWRSTPPVRCPTSSWPPTRWWPTRSKSCRRPCWV